MKYLIDSDWVASYLKGKSDAVEFLNARIRGQLRKQGRLIGDPDVPNAATALDHGLSLVTRNLKDFERIPNLTIYYGG